MQNLYIGGKKEGVDVCVCVCLFHLLDSIREVRPGEGYGWASARGGEQRCPFSALPSSPTSPSALKKLKVKDKILRESLAQSRNKTFIKASTLKQVTGIEVHRCRKNLKERKHP